MRAAMMALAGLALAACGQSAAPAPAAAVEAAAPEDDGALRGPFVAVSTTAMSITGDMSFSTSDVSFMNGILLHTEHLTTGAVFDAMNAAGDSYDDVAPGADDRVVDLRRVTSQEVTSDAAQGGLCGATAPTFVAIVHDAAMANVAVIGFMGAVAPGANSAGDNVCATYSYQAQ